MNHLATLTESTRRAFGLPRLSPVRPPPTTRTPVLRDSFAHAGLVGSYNFGGTDASDAEQGLCLPQPGAPYPDAARHDATPYGVKSEKGKVKNAGQRTPDCLP